jgi:dephospho-CoA kinase
MSDDARTATRFYGLTGGIGSGKSTVAELLRARGIPVFDADEAARAATRPGGPGWKEVAEALGPDVVRPDATLDRPAIARRAFADPSLRRRLEEIIHPLVDRAAREWRERCLAENRPLAFVCGPLLLETGRDRDLDGVVAVVATEEARVRRVVDRDRVAPEAVRARMAAQMSDVERMTRAAFVLLNDGGPEELQAQVESLLARLR